MVIFHSYVKLPEGSVQSFFWGFEWQILGIGSGLIILENWRLYKNMISMASWEIPETSSIGFKFKKRVQTGKSSN